VIYTGTLVAKKGVIPLMKAWPKVLAACPLAELHCYGKDGRINGSESMQQHLLGLLPEQAKSRVFFHGHVARQQVIEALRSARVAVFPSYSEAFALAPLEAMAQGCPTIYSRRASGPEVITDGRDGLLVEPDDQGQIAEAIVRVLQDHSMAQRLGEAGWRRVRESFSTPVVVENNLHFYQKCVATYQA
jgi:glycosyltransferase involved in cell wall biosynthesis